MADRKKLDRWAEKLLDTGKRNPLINFRDSKTSTAEIVFPNCESVFSKCSVGRVFEVFDPKLPNSKSADIPAADGDFLSGLQEQKLDRESYRDTYAPRLKSERFLLVYAGAQSPLAAVKAAAKKAQEMQDETGINVAYLAFGFVKWREKKGSEIFYRAPLLLVHVNILLGSVIDPIRIEVSDDDVVVNPTFNYFLQAEHGISLPDYADGDTLSVYYSKVADTVQKMGWEILDECKLGIFSFLKINMYEDLKQNAAQILENSNVRALLGEAPRDTASAFAPAGQEGRPPVENPLIELHTVVDADSSQIEAIELAKSGKSFVLQGPPGTGKSQTITNMIAECLYDGKKVLFVSEKQAALNVVYDKLKKAGLEDFCLELHSHKANKKAVIEELNRTLEVPKSKVSDGAEEEIRQKGEAQGKLDAYAAALHEKREGIDRSLYQLFELHAAQRSFPELPYTIPDIRTKGQEDFVKAVRLLEQYADYVPSVGQNYRENAWYGFRNDRLRFEDRAGLKADLACLVQGYKELYDTTARIQTKYETPELNFTDTQRWRSLLSFSAESDVITPSLLSRETYQHTLPQLSKMRELSAAIVPVRNRILESFTPEAIQKLDGKGLYTALTGQHNSLFSRMFSSEYKGMIGAIRRFHREGKKLSYQQAVEFSQELAGLQEKMQAFDVCASAVRGRLGECYHGPDTDWPHVMSALDTLGQYFRQDGAGFGTLSKMTDREFSDNQAAFAEDSRELDREIRAVAGARANVGKQFDPEIFSLEKTGYELCVRKLKACLADFDRLGNWIGFLSLLGQLDAAGLTSFVELVIARQTPPEEIVGAYRRSFYRQWIEYILFSVPELSAFSRIKQDQAVQSFVEKDALQYEISKLQIRSRLSQQRPSLEMVAGGSAVAVLRREGQKKRKQLPIRRLLADTGSLVQLIKPCFLMSPLSVSAFLDPEKLSFDTVVFDEASQIFPQDAVGAIYRGKQLIVVGDSRQMPPSNFFSRSVELEDEDEETGDITDFESVLDICSSVFPTQRLAWHYRSHYEQLIAFSNLHFYNNHLVTFPSASMDRPGIGVDYYPVDGVFDRRSKTNKEEARFIVELIYRNIAEYPERSLGVVAFSAAQQNLIDQLLSKKREADPSYEWFFKADAPEPFFVKNLETVQGDERDTIIFSIAYARDNQGRFIQNFGPLNRQGGERRLNVAVTRAKDNVQVVSSLSYTDINLSGTASEGVRLLRAYLDYAQNGPQALERSLTVSEEGQFDSDFEQEVCDALRGEGFTVDTQVGCAGYRIDLGLREPDSSNYLLAIECDGATYHSAKNARDRDSLRQRVLENMGWKFYRVWSTDWYRNQAVEKDRLLRAARAAVAEGRQRSAAPARREAPPEQTVTEEIQERFESAVEEPELSFPSYRQLDAMEILRKHNNELQSAVREILETEAPLSEEYLLKRIVYLFGREKVTKVVLQDYNRRMARCHHKGILRRNGFLYLEGMDEIIFRVPGDRRDVKYISPEELGDGLYTLIRQNVSTSRDGLYRAIANLLGFSRTGEAIVSKLEEALSLLKERNLVREEDGLLSLL